jgi:hypothetical protein
MYFGLAFSAQSGLAFSLFIPVRLTPLGWRAGGKAKRKYPENLVHPACRSETKIPLIGVGAKFTP